MEYKGDMTLEELTELVKDLKEGGYLEQWDQWFGMQPPSFQKMFDDAMKAKVKEYGKDMD
jgi:hypothetical protein